MESAQQLVSVAAALIPFLENDDANRALMAEPAAPACADQGRRALVAPAWRRSSPRFGAPFRRGAPGVGRSDRRPGARAPKWPRRNPRRRSLHAGATRRVCLDQRHRLALHVRAHQRAVGVVVLEERINARDRHQLLGDTSIASTRSRGTARRRPRDGSHTTRSSSACGPCRPGALA